MSDQTAHVGECAAMGEIGDEHKRLEPFVGSFAAEVKMWMGPGDPMVSTGAMTNSWDLGGRFLFQHYKGHESEGPFPNFEGRGYWGYNTVANKYEGFWIDTACTFMQTESGEVDASGKVWTMFGTMTDPSSGGPLKKRTVITLTDNDHHTMEMFFTGPDGNEGKMMEIRYERS